MSWFLKRSRLREKEDVRWRLRLRLTRWRHFLAAEGVCFDLLTDLREKLNGEYIFDRQYISSTLGQMFQSAYQVAHDRGILERSNDADMFLWLDHIKEQANACVRNFSKPTARPEPIPAADRFSPGSGQDSRNPESEAWAEEPEYLIIKGVLDLLDSSDRLQPDGFSDQSGNPHTFRQGLQFAHEQVLLDLIKPESWQVWIQGGVALPFKDSRPFSLFVIDVGQRTEQPTPAGNADDSSEFKILHSTLWRTLAEGLSSSCCTSVSTQDHRTWPLYLVVSENTLFLTGTIAAGKICLDVVLTGNREFNHWFLRWDKDLIDTQSHHLLAGLFGSDCLDRTGSCEVLCFNRTAEEVKTRLRKLGEALGS